MEANENQISPLIGLLTGEQTSSMAMRISPRLSQLLSTLGSLVGKEGGYSQEQLLGVDEAFKRIVYQKQVISGSLCRVFDKKLKYYYCFTCSLTQGGACICENCFTDHHLNHQFKLLDSITRFCDCGNQDNQKRIFFCKEHGKKEKEVRSKLSKKDIQIFNKETQFLLYLCLKAKEVGPIKQYSVIAFKIFSILHHTCENSYTYQQLLSQIFLRQFSKQYLVGQQGKTIFQLFLWQEWNKQQQQLLKQFSSVLCHLYSYQKMRKRIVIEYFYLHCSLERFVIWVNPLTGIDREYFTLGKLILKYLRSGKIPPLTLNYQFKNINSTAGCFMQIYRGYSIMNTTTEYVDILQESLKRVNISTFYSFAIIDRDSRAAITIVAKCYLKFLDYVMITLQKIKDKKGALLKIIRQSFQYIRKKQQVFNFCPQRTLLSSVFSFYQHDLSLIAKLTYSEMLQLFNQKSPKCLKSVLQKMLQSFLNLFRIENFNDYRDLTTDVKYQLNNRNFIVAALDFTCVRVLVTMLSIVNREYSLSQFIPLRNVIIGKYFMLQKWVHLYRVEKSKKDSITDQHALNQITTLMDTGLFVKIDDQIASTIIEFVGIINNLLYACESPLCEIVLSNRFQCPNRQKIFMIYRQCAWISSVEKPRLAFKTLIQNIICNNQLIKAFITQEYDGYSKGQKKEGQKYESNLSYCNRFFNDEVSDDTSQRFLKKLQSQSRNGSLTQFIFTEELIFQMVKFTKYIMKFLVSNEIKLSQAQTINITMNLLLQCIIVVYTETRSQQLKNIIYQINSTKQLVQNYTDYSKIIIGVLFEYFKKKPEKLEQATIENKKQVSKLKRELKMKAMKEKQGKFLQQHSMGEQKVEQNEDLCIICKTPSSNQHNLNYLCRMRFTNTFNRNILNNSDNLMVITTCRHKIHEKCLAQNIDDQDQYGMNYYCFLCKELSNLRIPSNLNSTNVQTYFQYFLTVISLQLSSNQSLSHLEQQYTTPHILCKLLYDSIVLSIYFYYFTLGKFYSSYIVPIVQFELIILRWLIKLFSAPKSVYLDSKDITLRNIEERVNRLLAQNKEKALLSQGQQTQVHGLDCLFLRISKNTQASITLIKNLQRFNFFKLPQDLRLLRKQMGMCISCKKFHSKTIICFLCGFKLCNICNTQMNIHIDSHLGTSVLIEVENGRYCYRYRNLQVTYISLYLNYIGEEFQEESRLPTLGEYKLNQQRLEKLIDQILKDCIQNTVQRYFKQADSIPACNIQ